jgi:methylglutaconyl-CoA hydratase
MLQKLNNLAQPTLVIIRGAVFGGGVGLVSCCDIAIASNDSIFSLSEVKVGLVPATIGPYVIRAIGERNARRFFTSGEQFGAEVAKNINLVHEVIEESELEEKVEFYKNLFKKNGPKAVVAAKKIVADIANKEIDSSVINHTCKVISELRMSEEGKEGVLAFLEKRDPNW